MHTENVGPSKHSLPFNVTSEHSRRSAKAGKSEDPVGPDSRVVRSEVPSQVPQRAELGVSPTPQYLPLLLGAEAAAELIGISESTLWKLHSQGRIPNPMRLGGRVVRWRREELEAWVRAGCPPRERWTYQPYSDD